MALWRQVRACKVRSRWWQPPVPWVASSVGAPIARTRMDRNGRGFHHIAGLARWRYETADRRFDVRTREANIPQRAVVELAKASNGCHSACNIDPLSRGIGVQN